MMRISHNLHKTADTAYGERRGDCDSLVVSNGNHLRTLSKTKHETHEHKTDTVNWSWPLGGGRVRLLSHRRCCRVDASWRLLDGGPLWDPFTRYKDKHEGNRRMSLVSGGEWRCDSTAAFLAELMSLGACWRPPPCAGWHPKFC